MSDQILSESSPHPLSRLLRAMLLLAILVGLCFFVFRPSHSLEQLKRLTEDSLQQGDYQQAESLARNAVALAPSDNQAKLLLGNSLAPQGRYQDALETWSTIEDDGSLIATEARCESGDLWLTQLKRPQQAVAEYLRAIEQQPENSLAQYRLAYIFGLSGRSRDALPHRLKLIELQQIDATLLYLVCTGDRSLENVETVVEYAAVSPADPLIRYALALQAFHEQDYERVETSLRSLLAEEPDLQAAWLTFGELFLVTQQEREFIDWHMKHGSQLEHRPKLWLLRGQWAQQHDQAQAALRCFWEVVKRDPTDQEAVYQLARLLNETGRSEQAKSFLERSDRLQQYYALVKDLSMTPDPQVARETVQLAEELDLLYEAYGWALLVAQQIPDTNWAQEVVKRLGPTIPGLSLQRTANEFNPARSLDLSDFPLPIIEDSTSPEPTFESADALSTRIRFRNEATERGVNFHYDNGSPRTQQSRRMFEFLGGGVGVLDYDGDHRPDLWFTQGNRQFSQTSTLSPFDRLYRNQLDDSLEDVTRHIGIREHGFSTGLAVGDYDNDGFSDLFICNIGQNRLLRNNGDGTFSDVIPSTGIEEEAWSTSALFADLNADGLPDLYVANYLQGDDVFSRLCYDENQHVHSCIPANFDGQDDRLYLNLGDGEFEDVSTESGLVPAGKGLGVVAVDLDGQAGLELFVANDAESNFLYINQSKPQEIPRFEEAALIRGLALNAGGAAEACMGIAVGDVNRDHIPDLLVTNFYQESNTLYLNQPGGLFQDRTRTQQLHDGSLKMLGFGTQFLDADFDGQLDLILTNGHVDDLTDRGEPYEMPAQFYRGHDHGFILESPHELGPFFQERQLGRGLAILDWNRDGREDVAISHLDTPAALLTNQSASKSHFLGVRLRGTNSNRDAVGTIVTLRCQAQQWTRQLVGGSGFQAANEARLLFGLDEISHIDELTCAWPSGEIQIFEDISANQDIVLIEGRDDVFPWP